MKKRLTALILSAALLISLCGCGSIFEKEYSSVTDYTSSSSSSGSGKSVVKNYYGLKQAILQLVDSHKDSGVVAFGNYDGDISTDLAAAVKEVRTQDALCAYCVDSVTYDLNHIVSYDEATIYIKYSRTRAETDKVVKVSYSTGLGDHLLAAMKSLQSKAVLLVNNSALDEAGVTKLVSDIYMEDPQCAVSLPETQVVMYTGAGTQRLFEISFNYGDTAENCKAKLSSLDSAVTIAARASKNNDTAKSFLAVCSYITGRCTLTTKGDTAYDAMVLSKANSQGMALGFVAVCSELGLDCRVVKGQKDKKEHYWNIIKIGQDYYHVDLSVCRTDGVAAGFMRGDKDMRTAYSWDTAAYPECRGNLSYNDAIS